MRTQCFKCFISLGPIQFAIYSISNLSTSNFHLIQIVDSYQIIDRCCMFCNRALATGIQMRDNAFVTKDVSERTRKYHVVKLRL